MADKECYEDEIQIIAEKLTSTTTIESVFNPIQQKAGTFRTSNDTSNEITTYDGLSEGNKSNTITVGTTNTTTTVSSTSMSVATAGASHVAINPAVNAVVGDVDINADVNIDINIDIDVNADNHVDVDANADADGDADVDANADADANNTIADNSMVRNLPELNLPEKILLVIDTVREENGTQFKFGTGAKYPPLVMIKRAIEMFVSAKNSIQRRHEFALMTLDLEDSQWVCDFTSSVKTIVSRLNTIAEDASDNKCRTYDLGHLFEKIQAQLPLPEKNEDPAAIATTFIARVILIYARSNCIPKFHRGSGHLEKLAENPYFFLDVLYVHEPLSKENLCEEIYNEITNLEMSNFSYIMEVGRNAAKLHDGMAKLLAHPLQRPPQREVSYTLCSSTISHQAHANV